MRPAGPAVDITADLARAVAQAADTRPDLPGPKGWERALLRGLAEVRLSLDQVLLTLIDVQFAVLALEGARVVRDTDLDRLETRLKALEDVKYQQRP